MKTLKELREKTLTPAEKKKREEIAKGIEKDDPDMPMDKKMAIATATAKKVAEDVNEAVDYFKVAKAFDDYAKKSGGIDKKEFMKVGQFVRQLGKESDVNKQDRTFMAMKKFIGAMDTDPRDGVIQIFQKHGMYKDGRIMRESVEEARAPRPPKLKGNGGPYTRQQIEKAAKEAKVDIGAKARMMLVLRKMS